MDRLNEALHDVHHKGSVGGDQLPSGRKYRRGVEGIYWKGIPTVSDLARKAQINRHSTRVDLPRCQCRVDSIEFNQWQVSCGGARFLNSDPGRHTCLTGLG